MVGFIYTIITVNCDLFLADHHIQHELSTEEEDVDEDEAGDATKLGHRIKKTFKSSKKSLLSVSPVSKHMSAITAVANLSLSSGPGVDLMINKEVKLVIHNMVYNV